MKTLRQWFNQRGLHPKLEVAWDVSSVNVDELFVDPNPANFNPSFDGEVYDIRNNKGELMGFLWDNLYREPIATFGNLEDEHGEWIDEK